LVQPLIKGMVQMIRPKGWLNTRTKLQCSLKCSLTRYTFASKCETGQLYAFLPYALSPSRHSHNSM